MGVDEGAIYFDRAARKKVPGVWEFISCVTDNTGRWRDNRRFERANGAGALSLKFAEEQPQILRLRKPQKTWLAALRMTISQ